MSIRNGIVFVVDDDRSVREALSSLIRAVGRHVETFSSAVEFMRYDRPDAPACLVLDVRMPGLSGLELQTEISRSGRPLPIIFVTGHGDVPMSVRAMKAGAAEFLQKPFRDSDLVEAIEHALVADDSAREGRAQMAALRNRYEALTVREREVMALVVKGLLNKQTADELKIAEITVKVHRRHIMQKMQARSVAALVLMAQKLRGDA
jgi:FixJ family two-component response regulator